MLKKLFLSIVLFSGIGISSLQATSDKHRPSPRESRESISPETSTKTQLYKIFQKLRPYLIIMAYFKYAEGRLETYLNDKGSFNGAKKIIDAGLLGFFTALVKKDFEGPLNALLAYCDNTVLGNQETASENPVASAA
jgi:hypothetical protein